MEWTREEIENEVLDYMDFMPSLENKGMYSDNQKCWDDRTIEELIYDYVDNYDNHFSIVNANEEEIKEGEKFIYEFCKSAKKLFNMGTDLDGFIEEYKEN